MKNLITLFALSFLFAFPLLSQNEFGTVGSYWTYSYSRHDGGEGPESWDIISVDSDTIIDGEVHKILRRTFHHTRLIPPSVNQGSYLIGLMRIDGDSVYLNGSLHMDLNMELADSFYIPIEGFGVDIKLAIDSITTEEIGGYEYKKWHGQKICIDELNGNNPYESFTFLESVGQIERGYFLWNMDGCLIGGGTRTFSCYKNGDFTYPPGMECELLMLTGNRDILAYESIDVFPNPVKGIINITSEKLQIDQLVIFDLTGKELFRKNISGIQHTVELNFLSNGLYFMALEVDGKQLVYKFVKN
ncbi:MAG: hypothetical protein ACI8X3_000854 [Saprospiraceae bacterium]|jgi:hypothetical protein